MTVRRIAIVDGLQRLLDESEAAGNLLARLKSNLFDISEAAFRWTVYIEKFRRFEDTLGDWGLMMAFGMTGGDSNAWMLRYEVAERLEWMVDRRETFAEEVSHLTSVIRHMEEEMPLRNGKIDESWIALNEWRIEMQRMQREEREEQEFA